MTRSRLVAWWLALGLVAPQIGVSGDFAEAYSAPSNVATAAYAMALGETWRWGACL
jgi:hypothetical protein